ncbi:MAG: DUF4329 domain-containing protein [Dinoroseobacter sp.]|nr:DUF4329 domain-containing protein [Dinoroseobacter sp.]
MVNKLASAILVLLMAVPAAGQSVEEHKFVVHLMNRLQPPSFAQSREYCGFIIRDDHGKITTGRISPGTTDSCAPQRPERGQVLSSFHTHGGFSRVHINEIPSVQDLEGDIASRTNGWVATPGGRLWFNDWRRGTAQQVCGVGCLLTDPAFIEGDRGKVDRVYTLDKLVRLMGR